MSFNGRVPKTETASNGNSQSQKTNQAAASPEGQLPLPRDEEKMPLFLIKLWNIVEDPSLHQIIRWDESGTSFHIIDPYSFCRNVLPHYFKHNNINSLIRQLNMYGFRKMTPLNQGGLTRTESDQDHLEFSHPYFVRDHPDFLVNIKRKQSIRNAEPSNLSVQTQANLELVMNEIRSLREKQKNMDNRMHQLVNENRNLHHEVSQMNQQHNRQQAIVKKLVQFLIVMVQPRLTNRMMKRGVLAIDEPPVKRSRPSSQSAAVNSSNLSELLDRLERELINNADFRRGGPIIADVTDETDQTPLIEEQQNDAFVPPPVYTHDNHDKQQQQGNVTSPQNVTLQPSPNMSQQPQGQYRRQMATAQVSGNRPVRYASTLNKGHDMQQHQPQQIGVAANNGQTIMNDAKPVTPMMQSGGGVSGVPSSSTELEQYMPPPTTSTSMNRRPHAQMSSGDGSPHNQDFPQAFSPTIAMSPSLDRQISQELQDYFNGVDLGIDSCRDLLTNTDWNFDFNDELSVNDPRQMYGHQLALENVPNQQIQQQAHGGQQNVDGTLDYIIDQANSPLVQAVSPGTTSSGATSVDTSGTGGQNYGMGGFELEGLEPLFEEDQYGAMSTPDPLSGMAQSQQGTVSMPYSPPTHTNSSGPLIANQVIPPQAPQPNTLPQTTNYRRPSGSRR